MHRELVHLYGPLAINSFGLFIIIGLVVFSALILSDPKRARLIGTDQYFNALSLAILTAMFGGRALFVITHLHYFKHWWEFFAFWMGGFSLLGAAISLLLVIPIYLLIKKIKCIELFDLAAIYLPLLQSISRIGCFFAGCCFGLPTSLPFGVMNNECGIAGLNNKPLHPTQLYHACALFCIFLLLYFVLQYYFKKPGQLICAYLFLMSIERFLVDFWRADREFLSTPGLQFLSVPQLVAISIALGASIVFAIITFGKNKRVHS